MPDHPKRKSPRLQGYDYTQDGAYFVTICTQHRECLFDSAIDGEMWLNLAGEMVTDWWNKLPTKFPNMELDAFIAMPNHVHGIIVILRDTVGADPRIRPSSDTARISDVNQAGAYTDAPYMPNPRSQTSFNGSKS